MSSQFLFVLVACAPFALGFSGSMGCAGTDSASDVVDQAAAAEGVSFGGGPNAIAPPVATPTTPAPSVSVTARQAPSPVPTLPPVCKGCPDPLVPIPMR